MQPSRNRFQGDLSLTEFQRVLDECRRHLITGTILVDADGQKGDVELRAGVMTAASFVGQKDSAALEALNELTSGRFEIMHRLPDPTGELGSSAACYGDLATTSLVSMMRYCEEHALSCSIDVYGEQVRGTLVYRAGDLISVLINGLPNEDRIVDLTRLASGRFDVTVPRLNLALPGRPRFARSSTAAFGFDLEEHDDETRALLDEAKRSLESEAAQPPSATPEVESALPPTPRRGLSRLIPRFLVRGVEKSLGGAENGIARTRRSLRKLLR
jgi:hypothetical protein